jgi:hypothetical protein
MQSRWLGRWEYPRRPFGGGCTGGVVYLIHSFVKGGKETHQLATHVRTVLSACYRSQVLYKAVSAIDYANASQKLGTAVAWLEKGGVIAVKLVEDVGIPKKALRRGSGPCGATCEAHARRVPGTNIS